VLEQSIARLATMAVQVDRGRAGKALLEVAAPAATGDSAVDQPAITD
jgi:hypothetical protein